MLLTRAFRLAPLGQAVHSTRLMASATIPLSHVRFELVTCGLNILSRRSSLLPSFQFFIVWQVCRLQLVESAQRNRQQQFAMHRCRCSFHDSLYFWRFNTSPGGNLNCSLIGDTALCGTTPGCQAYNGLCYNCTGYAGCLAPTTTSTTTTSLS